MLPGQPEQALCQWLQQNGGVPQRSGAKTCIPSGRERQPPVLCTPLLASPHYGKHATTKQQVTSHCSAAEPLGKEQGRGAGLACQAVWGAPSGGPAVADASRLSSASSPSTSRQCLPARIWAYFAIWGGTTALRRASTCATAHLTPCAPGCCAQCEEGDLILIEQTRSAPAHQRQAYSAAWDSMTAKHCIPHRIHCLASIEEG